MNHFAVIGFDVTSEDDLRSLVERLAGWAQAIDVVLHPSQLAEMPRPGGVLSGSFWLSGRLLSQPGRKPGWLRKLARGAG